MSDDYKPAIIQYLLQRADKFAPSNFCTKIRSVLNEHSGNSVGFVINERLLHFPAEITSPSFRSLLDEYKIADKPPNKQKCTLKIWYYLLIRLYPWSFFIFSQRCGCFAIAIRTLLDDSENPPIKCFTETAKDNKEGEKTVEEKEVKNGSIGGLRKLRNHFRQWGRGTAFRTKP